MQIKYIMNYEASPWSQSKVNRHSSNLLKYIINSLHNMILVSHQAEYQ